MASQSSQSDPRALLLSWLRRDAAPDAVAWLENQLQALNQRAGNQKLFVAIGLASRRFARSALQFDDADLAAAAGARPGWDPRGWSLADAARILLLAELSRREPGFPKIFTDICRTADVSESVAFYRGLPLYDRPGELEAQAAEGARSNMQVVFEAVAHRNPYPREQFDEQRWNHMILKALFIGSALAPVQGLDERSNPRLAAMLLDYAHERWAAGRTVSPELWRCVGPFADEAAMADFERLLDTGTTQEREAAILALSASPDPAVKPLLDANPDLARQAASGALTWERVTSQSEPAQ
ncbi:MAG: EboA domain-containing protein [Hyphomicrobiales bacterium]